MKAFPLIHRMCAEHREPNEKYKTDIAVSCYFTAQHEAKKGT